MASLFDLYVSGQLASVAPEAQEGSGLPTLHDANITIDNQFNIPVMLFAIDGFGRKVACSGSCVPGDNIELKSVPVGTSFLIVSALTGAYITAITLYAAWTNDDPSGDSEDQYSLILGNDTRISRTTTDALSFNVPLDNNILQGVNMIGPVPKPANNVMDGGETHHPYTNGQTVIPADGDRILVGSGISPSGQIYLREQYWRRTDGGYSIAPGETQVVSFTQTNGVTRTNRSESSSTTSTSASASIGSWFGSASISASLTTRTSHVQEVSVSDEKTNFVSRTIEGPAAGGHAEYFLNWQMMDVISIISAEDEGYVITDMVEFAHAPIISDGPYKASSLPAGPSTTTTQPVSIWPPSIGALSDYIEVVTPVITIPPLFESRTFTGSYAAMQASVKADS